MGKLLKRGRAQRGIDFMKGRVSIWIGLARRDVWPDENIPLDEDIEATALTDDMFGMKLFEEAALVIEDDTSNQILFEGKKYRKLTNDEALQLQATELYLKFTIEPDEFPGITYRQVGVFIESIPAEGFSDFSALEPNKFTTLGNLIYMDNGPREIRYPNTRHLIEVIIPG
jgi:hypothetical protein